VEKSETSTVETLSRAKRLSDSKNKRNRSQKGEKKKKKKSQDAFHTGKETASGHDLNNSLYCRRGKKRGDRKLKHAIQLKFEVE